MIDISKGRYWDFGWQIIDGCTPCSPGCDNCWSASMTHRFNFQWTDKGRFNGEITVHPEKLNIPLKRKKPAVYAIWNDFGHEKICDALRLDIVSIAVRCPQHIFLALTKRTGFLPGFVNYLFLKNMYDDKRNVVFPDNWWNGLTVCNQQEADEKIPIFLKVPGKKFLSIEPMLSEIDIRVWAHQCITPGCGDQLNAVILGGETGAKARPMNPDWVRSVRDQCQAAGVPFFFKSWGEWSSDCGGSYSLKSVAIFNERDTGSNPVCLKDLEPWRREIWDKYQQGDERMYRVGKKAAGRYLDGVTHNALPWRG